MSDISQNTGQPRTRQRAYKAPPQLDVPDIEDDAAERKRVLNVLAQRRYREKKRERRLKQQSQNKSDKGSNEATENKSPERESYETANNSTTELEIGRLDGLDGTWPSAVDALSMPLLLNSNMDLDFPQNDSNWITHSSSLNPVGDASSFSLFTSSSGVSSPVSLGTSPASTLSDGSLADSYLIPVYELTLLKGLMRIAERVGAPKDVWSLTSLSPFAQGGGTPADQLPLTLQPTAAQLLEPHHPFLDFLPWPSVRDKVIGIFSLPEESRPQSAAGPMGLVHLAYDVEDNSEGVRIYGDDPYDPAYWEVGQVFFQRWWFLFDREIIATSNRWRRLRGAPPLAIKAAGEEGS